MTFTRVGPCNRSIALSSPARTRVVAREFRPISARSMPSASMPPRRSPRSRPRTPSASTPLRTSIPTSSRPRSRSVVTDFDVRATKTGMLAQASTVERVGALAREGLLPHLVVDPVLVATSGDVLMEEGRRRGVPVRLLFPFAEIVTPNLERSGRAMRGRCRARYRSIDDLDDARAHRCSRSDRATCSSRAATSSTGRTRTGPPICSSAATSSSSSTLRASRPRTITAPAARCRRHSRRDSRLGRTAYDATRDAKSFVLAALEGARRRGAWAKGAGRSTT